MIREIIGFDTPAPTLLAAMSEGDAAAEAVVGKLLFSGFDGLFTIGSLDDMNIRGRQITVGFNKYAGGDLSKFTAAVESRDQALVDAINSEFGPGAYKAVTYGASGRQKPTL